MIIDCHGHYTTAPDALGVFRAQLLDTDGSPTAVAAVPAPIFTDEELSDSIESAQLRLQRERGVDLTVFSPQASWMGHDQGGAAVSARWSAVCNDLIARVCALFPGRFIGVGQLPQSPGVSPANCAAEIRRCVRELGFVGFNLNPDPSGGFWTDPPLTDEWWFPVYEALIEHEVPAMIHVSGSHNPNFQTTGGYYLAADTTVFMQLLTSTLFERYPDLKMVIPHGGGAVPYHWGRYRGIAQDMNVGTLENRLLNNVYFDTCVYHEPGIRLLTEVVPTANILFGSEIIGAVRGVDPRTGFNFDDTGRYIEAVDTLTDEQRADIYEHNVRRVYPLLDRALTAASTQP